MNVKILVKYIALFPFSLFFELFVCKTTGNEKEKERKERKKK
jgi:hypothetical protein